MDFEQVVRARRSIRKFTDQAVSDEQVLQILTYGHCAPSAGNLREWEFIVVREQANKEKITACTFGGRETTNPPQQWIATAPVILAVVADLKKVEARYGAAELHSLPYLDCSAAIENMLLGAVHLGLASCYISGFRQAEMKSALGVPEGYEVIALLPVGYPAEAGIERERGTAGMVTHQERFSEQRS